MDELISKKAAIEAAMQDVSRIRTHEFNAGATRAANRIKALPPVEPKRIRGRWIYSSYDDESGFDESWECDKCGYMTNIEETNFCPNCGAKMEEKT